MGSHADWPDDKTEILIKLYNERIPVEKISEQTGKSCKSVTRKIARLKAQGKLQARKQLYGRKLISSDWTDDRKAQARALWDEGHSLVAIGLKMKVSRRSMLALKVSMNWPGRSSVIHVARKDEWVPEKTARLVKLWNEGITLERVSEWMNISRNSITGKVHRLIREGVISKRNIRMRAVTTAPKLKNMLKPAQISAAQPLQHPAPVKTPDKPPKPSAAVISRFAEMPRYRRGASCCWPIGEPGDKNFRYCDSPDVLLGKPYCLEHCQISYGKGRTETASASRDLG